MRGIAEIRGANTYAWLEGVDLLAGIEYAECRLKAQVGNRLQFEMSTLGGMLYPELYNGRFAIRYPIIKAPSFAWSKEPVTEVVIMLHTGAMGHPVKFVIPTKELESCEADFVSETCDFNFRLWALKELERLTKKPTEANGLRSRLDIAEAKEWAWKYAPPSPSARKKAYRMYQLEVYPVIPQPKKPDGGRRMCLCPDWGSFLKSIKALVEDLADFSERRDDG